MKCIRDLSLVVGQTLKVDVSRCGTILHINQLFKALVSNITGRYNVDYIPVKLDIYK